MVCIRRIKLFIIFTGELQLLTPMQLLDKVQDRYILTMFSAQMMQVIWEHVMDGSGINITASIMRMLGLPATGQALMEVNIVTISCISNIPFLYQH